MNLLDNAFNNALTPEELAATFRAEAKRMLTPDDIATEIPGKGIYLGTWTPFAGQNDPASKKTFDVFAAPEDVAVPSANSDFLTVFNAAFAKVGGLSQWHGHNGECYYTHEGLFGALKNNVYKGGWFIPPQETLSGCDVHFKDVEGPSIRANLDKGELEGTFSPAWYLSCTKPDLKQDMRYILNLTGNLAPGEPSSSNCYVRPCRLEPR
jgi:hypothetical protein